MKRSIILGLALSIILTLLLAGVAYAGSAKSNARAEFEPSQTRVEEGIVSANASGHAIINYVKDADVWEVNGAVKNLEPDTNYKVQIGKQGVPYPQCDAGIFTTDSKGKADFHYMVVITGALATDYSAVRIIDLVYSPPLNSKCGGTIVMQALEDGALGTLQFRGDNRVKH